jgi:hypothetical protein
VWWMPQFLSWSSSLYIFILSCISSSSDSCMFLRKRRSPNVTW